MAKHRQYKNHILFLENGHKEGYYFVTIYQKGSPVQLDYTETKNNEELAYKAAENIVDSLIDFKVSLTNKNV